MENFMETLKFFRCFGPPFCNWTSDWPSA